MKKLEIAGIPFTEEMFDELRRWIVPSHAQTEADINDDIDGLLEIQSFLIHNWRSLQVEDAVIKTMLENIDYLRRRLSIFGKVKIGNMEGGEA